MKRHAYKQSPRCILVNLKFKVYLRIPVYADTEYPYTAGESGIGVLQWPAHVIGDRESLYFIPDVQKADSEMGDGLHGLLALLDIPLPSSDKVVRLLKECTDLSSGGDSGHTNPTLLAVII